MKTPTVLCILDGWGLSDDRTANAVALAETPHFDRIMAECPNATLVTHGVGVGLPEGQMGNSEVGHMNIGAGRVVEMDLRRIDGAIERGEFARLPGVVRFVEAMQASGGVAHLCGVLSDGGVHSHIAHIPAMAAALDAGGVPYVLHAFTDGRDVAPSSAAEFLEDLQAALPNAQIATISGRYYAMDRDNRWERVGLAYAAMMRAEGPQSDSAADVIAASYASEITDEFILPHVIGDYAGIKDGDGLMFLNFRADRAREILAALGDPEFDGFETGPRPAFKIMSGYTEYSDRHDTYMDCVFPSEDLVNTLGEWVAKQGKTQFRIAETEKYPHVTFFLNGGVEAENNGETRYLAPSPKVATYDLQPEMSSGEVTENLVQAIRSGAHDLIVVNYANPDMVGHTGDLEAAKAACAAVDQGLGKVLSALGDMGGAMILCADHGNCETMFDPETGGPHTAHTLNPVPVALIGGPKGATVKAGKLADLAPTLLELMGLPQPEEMTGQSLLDV